MNSEKKINLVKIKTKFDISGNFYIIKEKSQIKNFIGGKGVKKKKGINQKQ